MKTWKRKVKDQYQSLDELECLNDCYGIAKRCGYNSAKELWDANPMIGGSTNPDDFGVVGRAEAMDDAERAALAREVFKAVITELESLSGVGVDLAYLMGAILEKRQDWAFVDWAADVMPSPPLLHELLEDMFAEDHLVWEFINTKTREQLEREES